MVVFHRVLTRQHLLVRRAVVFPRHLRDVHRQCSRLLQAVDAQQRRHAHPKLRRLVRLRTFALGKRRFENRRVLHLGVIGTVLLVVRTWRHGERGDVDSLVGQFGRTLDAPDNIVH